MRNVSALVSCQQKPKTRCVQIRTREILPMRIDEYLSRQKKYLEIAIVKIILADSNQNFAR